MTDPPSIYCTLAGLATFGLGAFRLGWVLAMRRAGKWLEEAQALEADASAKLLTAEDERAGAERDLFEAGELTRSAEILARKRICCDGWGWGVTDEGPPTGAGTITGTGNTSGEGG
jgi:hypothetical protein